MTLAQSGKIISQQHPGPAPAGGNWEMTTGVATAPVLPQQRRMSQPCDCPEAPSEDIHAPAHCQGRIAHHQETPPGPRGMEASTGTGGQNLEPVRAHQGCSCNIRRPWGQSPGLRRNSRSPGSRQSRRPPAPASPPDGSASRPAAGSLPQGHRQGTGHVRKHDAWVCSLSSAADHPPPMRSGEPATRDKARGPFP